jgi:hypothetical protein
MSEFAIWLRLLSNSNTKETTGVRQAKLSIKFNLKSQTHLLYVAVIALETMNFPKIKDSG